jgi:hypothetical protein
MSTAVEAILSSVNIDELIHQKLETWDLSKDVQEPLDTGLNRLVESLKNQIPMAAMFLSGPLVEKLKGIAKEEILKMIPDIKKKLFLRAKKELDFRLLIENSVNAFFIVHFLPLLRRKIGYWGGIVAAIAFIFFGFLTWFLLQMRL